MRLSVKALAITMGILWGGCMLLVGIINLAAPAYGLDFLRGMGSVYPGFFASRTFGDALLGAVYGFVDGAIAGWLLGLLYNWFSGTRRQSGAVPFDRAA